MSFLTASRVEAPERLGVVEGLAHRVGQGGVLVQHVELHLVRPPVPVRRAAARGLSASPVHDRASAFVHDPLLCVSCIGSKRSRRPRPGVGQPADGDERRRCSRSCTTIIIRHSNRELRTLSGRPPMKRLPTMKQLQYLVALAETRHFAPRRRALPHHPVDAERGDPRSGIGARNRGRGAFEPARADDPHRNPDRREGEVPVAGRRRGHGACEGRPRSHDRGDAPRGHPDDRTVLPSRASFRRYGSDSRSSRSTCGRSRPPRFSAGWRTASSTPD